MSRRVILGLGLVVVLLLSACQADIRVGMDVKSDGSGTVTVSAHLDHDAASSYAQYVRTSDLLGAGWTVTGPTAGTGGSVDFSATKGFAGPAGARAVIAEVSGPNGPFRSLVITQHSSLFQTTTSFQGTVDLTCGLNCFSDPQLQQALGGRGIDPSTLQADAGVALDRIFRFQVAVRLPGTIRSSNAGAKSAGRPQWTATLGQKAVLTASARAWNIPHLVLAAVVALLVLLAAAVGVLRLVRRRR